MLDGFFRPVIRSFMFSDPDGQDALPPDHHSVKIAVIYVEDAEIVGVSAVSTVSDDPSWKNVRRLSLATFNTNWSNGIITVIFEPLKIGFALVALTFTFVASLIFELSTLMTEVLVKVP